MPSEHARRGLHIAPINLHGRALDPGAGTGTLAREAVAFSDGKLRVHTRDISPSHSGLDEYGDSLLLYIPPSMYEMLLFSPPFLLTDLFVVWAVAQPVQVVIMHVASDYLTNAPTL